MPIVTITVQKPKSAAFKAGVLESVHLALIAAGVNPRDRFHRVLELPPEDFCFDPSFPDLQSERTGDFVLIEILLGVGRSVKVKKEILRTMMEGLRSRGHNTENIMVCFQDVPWENWSAGGGRMLHV